VLFDDYPPAVCVFCERSFDFRFRWRSAALSLIETVAGLWKWPLFNHRSRAPRRANISQQLSVQRNTNQANGQKRNVVRKVETNYVKSFRLSHAKN